MTFNYLYADVIHLFSLVGMKSTQQVDLHPDIAEYLQRYRAEKSGLLFHTANNTPHLYGNLEDRWLTPGLTEMKLDEKGMGWHPFEGSKPAVLKNKI